MTPIYGSAARHPGPVTLGIFQDMGWLRIDGVPNVVTAGPRIVGVETATPFTGTLLWDGYTGQPITYTWKTAGQTLVRPAFGVVGKKGWIAEQDDFGRVWETCKAEGVFAIFETLTGWQRGPQTNGETLGISRVEADPVNREFYYMVAVEVPPGVTHPDLEHYQVPPSQWAVFECHGKIPEAIVEAELFAFMEWLPASDYVHALAPEMEVYYPGESSDDYYCEFWLPVAPKP